MRNASSKGNEPEHSSTDAFKAVRSVYAAERRLDELAERVSLAGDLLRTTVQVQLEDQNASLLTSMEERARLQVQRRRRLPRQRRSLAPVGHQDAIA